MCIRVALRIALVLFICLALLPVPCVSMLVSALAQGAEFGSQSGQWPTATAWTMMVVISFIGAIAHYALIWALDYAEAGAVQPYAYTLLVWATVMGFLVFDNVPDSWTILGAAIVVASGLYTWHHDRRLVR